MSGAICWKGDGNWQATCDVCEWKSPVDSHEGARSAQERHEAECRPPLPDRIEELEFLPPTCPVCSGSLLYDGGDWDCGRCELAWDNDGSHGRFVGDPAEAAPEEATA